MKVLISGAGIAGSCSAYWLGKTHLDLEITVVERSPTPRTSGQSLDIRGSAVEIVKRMNLEEALRSRHTTEEGTVIVNSAGKTFAHFEGGDTFTAEIEILRADLVALFVEATESMKNIQYIYGASIQSLEQSEKGANVTFTTGTHETYDLVIAADGSSSRTRPMILDESLLKDSYHFIGQYMAFFSIPSQPTDRKLWNWYSTPKGLGIMTRPHRTSTTIGAYLTVTMPAHGLKNPGFEESLQNGTDAQKRILHEYFEDAGWEAKRVLKGMDHAEDFYMTRAAQVKLPKWTNNRAVVIGDAAFATFGVGTSLAIESAYVLAGELSKIQESSDIPQALERYEATFRPIYNKAEGLIPGYPQLFWPQSSWGLWLRDMFLRFVSKTKIYRLLPSDNDNGGDLPEYNWKAT